MKVVDQFKLTSFEKRAIRLLHKRPRLTAGQFGDLMWPGMAGSPILSALHLRKMCNKGFVESRWIPRPWDTHADDNERPTKYYFLTDKGLTAHESIATRRCK